MAILTFDDNWKGQYLYVKPILDKYGFKATFFITCNWVGPNQTVGLYKGATAMTWDDLKSLHEAGHNIASHGMYHRDLTKLSQKDLDYEIGQSKQCLENHDINTTIFGNPFSTGWNNATIINTVAKYYDIDRAGYSPYAFLRCDYDMQGASNVTCPNRYMLKIWNHNGADRLHNHNPDEIMPEFIAEIEGQDKYNNDNITFITIQYVLNLVNGGS